MRGFLVQVLRRKITKPANRAQTLAISERNTKICEFILAERAAGATKDTAIESATPKFELAYDTIEDIFSKTKGYAEERGELKKQIFTKAVKTRHALRAVIEEMQRRGGYPLLNPNVCPPCPFLGLIGNPDDYR